MLWRHRSNSKETSWSVIRNITILFRHFSKLNMHISNSKYTLQIIIKITITLYAHSKYVCKKKTVFLLKVNFIFPVTVTIWRQTLNEWYSTSDREGESISKISLLNLKWTPYNYNYEHLKVENLHESRQSVIKELTSIAVNYLSLCKAKSVISSTLNSEDKINSCAIWS